MNILEQQASNRRRTWLVMLVFIAFLFLIGTGFDWYIVGTPFGGVPIGSIVALAVGSGSALFSYFAGDRAVLLSTHAMPLDQLKASATEADRLKLQQLDNVVDEMAIAAGLPRPKVYVVPDPDPNAFATGRDPAHASLAVTRGLLDTLDREELQGVVAHEMSHIRNYDVRLMTVIAALVGAVILLSDWASRSLWWGGTRRRDDNEGNGAAGALMLVVWLIGIILAPIVGQMLAMMVSRRREYLADASGAELTRNPLGLARALEAIDEAVEPTKSINRGTAHLCIADPVGHMMGASEHSVADLFATHPPMAQRIARLKAMAYQK
ncbi:MAG TPA: M48 family metalloprotease [Vicinamibacterales bacterium]|jgi:heat shock protein HtpX